MSRALHVDRCPDCNEVPKEGGSGILRCACNVRWQRGRGVRGTEAEDGLLTNAGLGRQDCPGDVYYVSQLGEIIYLFSNNEWGCDPRPLWTVAPWKITWLGATGSLLRFPRHHQKTISTLAAVAHALVRAASRLFSTPLRPSAVRRQECRRGTHECVRHCSLIVPPQIPALARRRLARVGLWRWAGHTGSRGCSRASWAR